MRVASGARHGERTRRSPLRMDRYGKGVLYVLTIQDNLKCRMVC